MDSDLDKIISVLPHMDFSKPQTWGTAVAIVLFIAARIFLRPKK